MLFYVNVIMFPCYLIYDKKNILLCKFIITLQNLVDANLELKQTHMTFTSLVFWFFFFNEAIRSVLYVHVQSLDLAKLLNVYMAKHDN